MNLAGRRLLALLAADVPASLLRDAIPVTVPVRFAGLREAVDQVPRLVDEAAPDLVVIGCGSEQDAALVAIQEVVNRAPNCPVVVLYQGSPNGFMDPAFRAGAEDVISLPLPPEQLDYMAEAQSGLMLTMLVGQGVLIEEGDGYRTSFDYTDGGMTLNGNPLPFGLQ